MSILNFKKNTDHDWEEIAQNNPYWGVIADEKFATKNMTNETKAEFFKSGKNQIEQIANKFNNFDNRRLNTVLDFGSGVGRLIIPMSEYAEQAIAIEISDSMIQEIHKNLKLYSKSNVKVFKTVNELIDSNVLKGNTVDWINSYIVFQHISPAIGYQILEKLLSILNTNGYFSLHFNIFKTTNQDHREVFQQIDSYTLNVLYIEEDDSVGVMQMYDYDLNKIHYLFLKYGISDYHCVSENHGGHYTVQIIGRKNKTSYFSSKHRFLSTFDTWAEDIPKLAGFAMPEEWGTWTDRSEASVSAILLESLRGKKLKLTLSLRAFLNHSNKQTFKIFANDNLLAEYHVKTDAPSEYTLKISPDITKTNPRLEIKFLISDPTSPLERGMGNDARMLGLGLSEMHIKAQ